MFSLTRFQSGIGRWRAQLRAAGMTRMFDGAPEVVFVAGFEAPARRVAH